jgi:hypothetical protein
VVACAKVADGVRVDHGSDGTYAARDCAMSAKVATDKVEDLIFYGFMCWLFESVSCLMLKEETKMDRRNLEIH